MTPGNEADAPSPELMREEFVNIVLGENPACGRFRAEKIVDAILAKQLAFYSQMAAAELDTSSVEAAMLIQELSGLAASLLSQGGAVAEYMVDREKWQRTAIRFRECTVKLAEMVG